MPRHNKSSAILCYHAISLDGEQDQLADERAFYAVDWKHFEKQMDFLAGDDFRSCLPNELLAGGFSDEFKSVMITFDDGLESDYTLALPALLSRGLRAVFFICVEYVGKPGYMTWEKIKALASAGMAVESHGLIHHDLTQLPEDEIYRELHEARICLERNLQFPIRYMSIPGGFDSPAVYSAAKRAGYQAVFNSVPRVARPGSILPRLAIRRDTSQQQFEGIVCQNRRTLASAELLHCIKSGVKATLGVQRYESLKQRLWP